MRIVGILVLCLIASGAGAQDHADVVIAVKAELAAKGADLTGACGAFAITKRVAWKLRGEQAGLLSKPAGNNCDAFAVDIIAYPTGQIVDILSDAGGSNGPMWAPGEVVEASRYRPAVDPGDTAPAPPPVVVVPPAPSPVDQAAVLAAIAEVRAELAKHDERQEHHWRDAAVWLTKYVLPAVGAFLGGRAMR